MLSRIRCAWFPYDGADEAASTENTIYSDDAAAAAAAADDDDGRDEDEENAHLRWPVVGCPGDANCTTRSGRQRATTTCSVCPRRASQRASVRDCECEKERRRRPTVRWPVRRIGSSELSRSARQQAGRRVLARLTLATGARGRTIGQANECNHCSAIIARLARQRTGRPRESSDDGARMRLDWKRDSNLKLERSRRKKTTTTDDHSLATKAKECASEIRAVRMEKNRNYKTNEVSPILCPFTHMVNEYSENHPNL